MAALPDRAPPEIEPGVTIDSLATIEECDAALDRLTMAIPSIEEQIARHASSPNQPADWRLKAEKALRIKKLLLPKLQQRRAEFGRQQKAALHEAGLVAARRQRLTRERIVLDLIKEIAPDALSQAVQVARLRHPEAFDEPAIGGA